MSLNLTIRIGPRRLYEVEVVRISGGSDPDDVNTYQVRAYAAPDMALDVDGTVQHRYGDGALVLSRKVHDLMVGVEMGRTLDGSPRAAAPDDVAIEDMDLPVRLYNALRRCQVRTLSDLESWTAAEILDIRNVGWLSLAALERAMATHGTSLRRVEP